MEASALPFLSHRDHRFTCFCSVFPLGTSRTQQFACVALSRTPKQKRNGRCASRSTAGTKRTLAAHTVLRRDIVVSVLYSGVVGKRIAQVAGNNGYSMQQQQQIGRGGGMDLYLGPLLTEY